MKTNHSKPKINVSFWLKTSPNTGCYSLCTKMALLASMKVGALCTIQIPTLPSSQ